MRVFFATGEASGDMLAATLADAMREFEPDASFAGIGGERMAAAGFTLTTRTTGWASLGPLAALRRIPPLLANMLRHAVWLRARPVDLIVLVDFGAYNLRFALTLRALGYRRPILYYVPPGAWLDRESQARAVARATVPLTPFRHQRDFYASLELGAAYFGHPLVSLVPPRGPRPTPPPDGGIVALLPGSRQGEIAHHLPRLLAACEVLRRTRPRVAFVAGAADADGERCIGEALAKTSLDICVVRGARAALDAADAAWVASGTAVLEAALREVPVVALYVIAEAQAPYARRIWLDRHPFITLPNIIMGRAVLPELLQEQATPAALARALGDALADPARCVRDLQAVRDELGDENALRRCAAFAVTVARQQRV